MIHYRFEALKLYQSKFYWFILGILTLIIFSIAFFEFREADEGQCRQNHAYEELLEEHKARLNFAKDATEFSLPITDGYSEEQLKNAREQFGISLDEFDIEREIEYLEHIIPYIEEMVAAYSSKDYLAFYEAKQRFITERSKKLEYIAGMSEDVPLEEMEPSLSAEDSKEYQLYQTFIDAGEPMEYEQASSARFNYLSQILKKLRHPFLFSFLLLTFFMIFFDEVRGSSAKWMLAESLKPEKWISNHFMLNWSLLFGLLLLSLIINYFIAIYFGNPVFSEAPSWQSPVIYRNEIIPDISLGIYLVISFLSVLCLFIFLCMCLYAMTILFKNVLVTVILFIGMVLMGEMILNHFPISQNILNPFYLFHLEHLLQNDGLLGWLINILVICMISLTLMTFMKRHLFRLGH